MAAQREQDQVFESVAELFGVLATPIRLKIISAVCQGEKNVSQLLDEIDTTQPNMSQHLSTLYRCGVLAKRREGTQVYYRLQSERVASLCRAVCTQVAMELAGEQPIEPNVARERHVEANAKVLRRHRVACQRDALDCDSHLGIDSDDVRPQSPDVEGVLPDGSSIVTRECIEQRAAELAHRAPLEQRKLPHVLARRAAIVEPDVERFLVRVDAETLAAHECACSRARRAVTPRTRQLERPNAPALAE